MHAALGVDLVERRVEADLHAEAERRGRPFEHGGLAERDRVGGDAVLGERRNGKDHAPSATAAASVPRSVNCMKISQGFGEIRRSPPPEDASSQ